MLVLEWANVKGGFLMSNVDYNKLKSNCFISQVQKDMFSLRLRMAGGKISNEKIKKVYEVAEKYANGYIHLTSRQSIEIPFIKFEDIEDVKKELAKVGLEPGACSAGVRTITACQGSAVCKSGLIDTTKLAVELDKLYYGRKLPHKFKIGITGCRNNCLKAEENDLGIKGGTKPKWSAENCSYCGACAAVCRTNAITVNKDDKTLKYDKNNCNMCGRCVKACPTKAWEGKSGYVIYFGGLFGNRIAIGKQLLPLVLTKSKLHKVIEATLTFFETHGKAKERFCNTLDRVGWDLFAKSLKEAIK
jgi:dissimilatory sulfite reductase (desulfoviridin) alpha/beta subunit